MGASFPGDCSLVSSAQGPPSTTPVQGMEANQRCEGHCRGAGTRGCAGRETVLFVPVSWKFQTPQDPQFCSWDPRQCWTHICRLDLPPLGSVPSAEDLFLDALVSDLPVLFTAALLVPRT